MFNLFSQWGIFVIGFITQLYEKIRDFLLHPIVFFSLIAGSVSFFAWGPLRWFLFSFIPNDAVGGWVAQLIITIVVGWVGGICIPAVILFIGLGTWGSMPRYRS